MADHDPRCISLTGSENSIFCDCRTLQMIDDHQPERCPECGHMGGHGLVHVRYSNGGGGNRLCPRTESDGEQ